MTLSQHIAGNTMAICTVWLVWVLLAPIAVGYPPTALPRHVYPAPYNAHGVGSDLRTYVRPTDRCATKSPARAGLYVTR